MRGVKNEPGKFEAIRMRIEDRASYDEISRELNLNKSTLYSWLRKFPLDSEESDRRRKLASQAPRVRRKKDIRDCEPSKWFGVVDDASLSRKRKAQIAEAAVLFRLALHGFEVFKSVFDGSRTDWFVIVPSGEKSKKIQVKWASSKRGAAPSIKITCSCGFKKYRAYEEGEYDAIVGYDLFSDTAYVYVPCDIGSRKNAITMTSSHAEKWDKLL